MTTKEEVLICLRKALEIEKTYLTAYEKPSEPIVYEVLRTADDLIWRDLMEPMREVSQEERLFRSISTWGINHALRRVIPKQPVTGPFRDFPSTDDTQNRADDFILHCGALAVAERLQGWLEDGLMVGEVRPYPNPGMDHVLIVQNGIDSCYDEEIGSAGLRWASDLVWQEGLPAERALEKRHREIAPKLEEHVRLLRGWQISYSCTREIDDYFLDWARLYLRRIHSQDMVGPDDQIGGRPFSRYLDVLTALSARAQKHVAFAAILRARHPSVHIRNLLTTYCPRRDFTELLARFMDADQIEIEAILNSFILAGSNLEAHTKGGDVTWAPIVQASTDILMLPSYGLDINPFLFLFTDLRYRYEADWFNVANNREARWIGELVALFQGTPWRTHGKALRLREAGKVVTDIDFATYQVESNELGLFQLKWQHPIGMDNRTRRSAGKNLVQECNQWIATVTSWLEQNGSADLLQKMGLKCQTAPKVSLFVLGRYHAHFGGYSNRDDRATWSSWAHLRRVCLEGQNGLTVEQIGLHLRSQVERARLDKEGESMIFPVGNVAIVLNPKSVPERK